MTISLFGGCAVSFDGRPVEIANKKGKALLGYLCFMPGFKESRERLVGFLWSESAEDKARNSLRHTLKSVRETLEAAGFNGFNTMFSDPGFEVGSIRVDVLEAIESIGADWPVDALVDQARIAESLLVGFDDVDPSFGHWIRVQRESLSRKLARELQNRLMAQPGVTPQARRIAEALLQTDPTHEPACRCVMRALADEGDLAGAITAYNRLCEELDTVHGQLPDAETEALIVAIKGGTYKPSAPPPAVSPAAHGFVGATAAAPSVILPRPAEKLVVIIGPFQHVGERKDLTFAFRHELMSRLNKFRELTLVDGEKPANLPAGAPCYTISAPVIEGEGEVNMLLSLKDSRTEAVVWNDVFNIELKNFFPALRQAMREIAMRLNVYISVERLGRVAAAPDISLDIYDRWLRGQWLTHQWEAGNRERARAIFESIVQDAPGFSPAYSSLAQMDNSDHIVVPGTYRTIDAHHRALARARRAVELDALDSRAHLAFAWANAFNGTFDLASLHFDQACHLNEGDAWTLTSAALGYAYGDLPEKAIVAADAALALLPAPSPLHWCYQSTIKFVTGDCGSCVRLGKQVGDAVSAMPAFMAASHASLGNDAMAKEEAQRLLRLVRDGWKGASAPTEPAIVRWVLQCFPIRNPAVLDRLRAGLIAAGLAV